MELRGRLIGRIHEEEVKQIASIVQTMYDEEAFDDFFQLLFDDERRVSENVAWIMSHFNKSGRKRLKSKKQLMIDEAQRTSNPTKLRLLLTILLKQTFSESEIETSFLDFCLNNITNFAHPIGIRSLSIYLSFQQCKFFPELLSELETTLHFYDNMPLTPGLKCAKTKVLREIKKIKENGLSSHYR